MATTKDPVFSHCGDVYITVRPAKVYLEVKIKNHTFTLTEQESVWLRDFLNQYVTAAL